MKVCFICTEIFAWGKTGGFGMVTRTIGRELVKRGVEVFAVVPRRKGQNNIENIDGIRVFGYPIRNPFTSIKLIKSCNADIYHSEEPSLVTILAMKAMPARKHVITFQDTRFLSDWIIEFKHPSRKKWHVLSNIIFEDNFLVRRNVKNADSFHAAAHLLIEKAVRKYRLKTIPTFLPCPIEVPHTISKADRPTVCFIGRWDRVKRPELFLKLAEIFPDVSFIAAGKSQDATRDSSLRKRHSHLTNLELPGFIDQFTSDGISRILERSWILINTSAKEALPVSFVEAAAHKCAIISAIDGDGFASDFGYKVTNDNFSEGLRYLLQFQRWKQCGQRGYEYVRSNFEMNSVMDKHIAIYRSLLGKRPMNNISAYS
jgi:glycosyltransferase involved in cell wall biosynthesis